jgi:hypothetical protein
MEDAITKKAKILKKILDIRQETSKNFSGPTEDEERFIGKHRVQAWEDPEGNGDDVYNATNVAKDTSRPADSKAPDLEAGTDEYVYEDAADGDPDRDELEKLARHHENMEKTHEEQYNRGYGNAHIHASYRHGRAASAYWQARDAHAKGNPEKAELHRTHAERAADEAESYELANGLREAVTEKHVTPEEKEHREKIVESMKKNVSSWRERYGDQAKSVVYATATKMAMGESTNPITSFHPHAVAARHEVEGIIGSQLHHDYDNNHLGYSSVPRPTLHAKLIGAGYTHDSDPDDSVRDYSKAGKHGITHRVTVSPNPTSSTLSQVRMEHSDF